MAIVNGDLAQFAAEVQKAYQKVCDNPKYSDDFFRIFSPTIELHTEDGLTAKFWEEGIEFYPEVKA